MAPGSNSERGQKPCIINADPVFGNYGVLVDMNPHRTSANLQRTVLTADQRCLEHHHGLPPILAQFVKALAHLVRPYDGCVEGLSKLSQELVQPLSP